MNWTNAVSNCEKENATLVIIHSAEENQFLNGQSIDLIKNFISYEDISYYLLLSEF